MFDKSHQIIDDPYDRPTLSHLLTSFQNIDTGELENAYDELIENYAPEEAFVEAYSEFYRKDVLRLAQFFFQFGVPENREMFKEEIRENLTELKEHIRPFVLYDENSKPFEPYLLLGKRDINWNDWQFAFGGYVLPEDIEAAFGDCSSASIEQAKQQMDAELKEYSNYVNGGLYREVEDDQEKGTYLEEEER